MLTRDDASIITQEHFVFNGLANHHVLSEPYARAYLEAGVNATVITFAAEHEWDETLRNWEQYLDTIDRSPLLHLAMNSSDLESAWGQGKLAVIAGTQGASMIDAQLWRISFLYRLGLRIIGLTYSQANKLASGCGEIRDGGLTFLGRDFIAAVNELPMFLDLSHTGHESRQQAIELAKHPTFTHANAYSVLPNDRNVKDEQLKAVSGKGGIAGLCGLPSTVRQSQASVADLVEHAAYMISTAGLEVCGLGLDYSDGYVETKVQPASSFRWRSLRPDIFGTNDDFFNLRYPKGIETIAGLSNLTAAFIEKGYIAEEIAAILGGNWLNSIRRVLG